MSTKSEFDFALTNYARAMRGYSRSIALAQEEVHFCRRRRVFEVGVDHFYHWHLNQAAVFRNNAYNWWSLAETYRKRLTEMHENAYYDNASQHVAA